MAKGPVQLLRGTGEADNMLRNVRDAYWNEAEEIAHYNVIEAVAGKLNDKETARLAKQFRREEERMQSFLARELNKLVTQVVRDEVPAGERRNGGTRRRTTKRRTSTASSNGGATAQHSASRTSSSARSKSTRPLDGRSARPSAQKAAATRARKAAASSAKSTARVRRAAPPSRRAPPPRRPASAARSTAKRATK